MNIAAILIGPAIIFLVAPMFGAAVLRGVCGMINMLFGGKKEIESLVTEFPASSKSEISTELNDPELLNRPYRSPASPLVRSKDQRINVVPEPTFGKAFVICLITMVVLALVTAMYSVTPSPRLGFAALTFNFVLVFTVLAILVKTLFPTTSSKSMLVVGWFFMAGLVMAASVCGVIVVVGQSFS